MHELGHNILGDADIHCSDNNCIMYHKYNEQNQYCSQCWNDIESDLYKLDTMFD